MEPLKNKSCVLPCSPPLDEANCVKSLDGGGDGWYCSVCAYEAAEDAMSDASYDYENIKESLYFIRDTFLFGNSKGELYAEYYSIISKHLVPQMTPDVATDILETIDLHLMGIIYKLAITPSSDDILYNDATASALISKLQELEAILDNPECTSIINQIELDVQYYKNKATSVV